MGWDNDTESMFPAIISIATSGVSKEVVIFVGLVHVFTSDSPVAVLKILSTLLRNEIGSKLNQERPSTSLEDALVSASS